MARHSKGRLRITSARPGDAGSSPRSSPEHGLLPAHAAQNYCC
ncbi:hypothetical protein [Kutzneria sp. NPDC051319]